MQEVLKPIEFAFRDAELTLQWAEPTSRVGYIRVHRDANNIPGPTLYTLAVELYADGTYEFKLLEKFLRGPFGEEMKRFNAYMESLGYVGRWRRFKEGKPPKIVEIA
ncbi:hypothetical protein [Nitrosovibrio sp. Nv4]|uniref:hypothetical protein n=1 Tax=Nitrosovibrio sp. Nv4 TaxID=1945880 RepID=UPI000BCAD4A8|nr:hypothetical protein [Nitrosovibrio sp. Nv4]SOD41306.1 hypothetical protein SAMN06298226_1601 [Nitrosovibrio sp. Nv4]